MAGAVRSCGADVTLCVWEGCCCRCGRRPAGGGGCRDARLDWAAVAAVLWDRRHYIPPCSYLTGWSGNYEMRQIKALKGLKGLNKREASNTP